MNLIKNTFATATLLCLIVTSCKQDPAQVRFYNATNADFFWKFGGCKYGTAEFLGELESFSTTNYGEVSEEGEYFVEFQNESGQWIPITNEKLGPVENGTSYSIWITTNRSLETTPDGNVSLTGNDNVLTYFQIKED